MAVFERRYLKKIPLDLAVAKICGVYTVEALEISVWFI
jgi:hypothetical protein